MINQLKKRRTIPLKGENITFFELYIYHFPRHKSNLYFAIDMSIIPYLSCMCKYTVLV